MAYYLKYRPQKIAELDLDSVRQSLGEILASQNIPHAFLFAGPKGTGKTSSARIVAKSLNCVKKTKARKGEPCGKCEMCRSIAAGTAIDLIEIDAASNRGIDDIRDLRRKIKLTPSLAKFKTYIIDEVHMLTREAFNALLKTLEEPPQHAMFVLCTTEPDKVPETIVSRCWRVNFDKAKTKEVIRSMNKVIKGEKLKIAGKDLSLIASQVDGSFRDAVKILELLATTGRRISSKRMEQVLAQGVVGLNLDEWLIMVYQREAKSALEWLGKATDRGMEPERLVRQVLERLRQVLLIRVGVESKKNDIVELDDLRKVRELSELLEEAGRQIKGAMIDSLPLELAVIEWAEADELAELAPAEETKTKESGGVEAKPEQEKKPAVSPKLSAKLGKLNIEAIKAKWNEVLETIRPQNYSLEALLRATRPTGFEGKFLVLEVFYKFHKERLEVDRYRQQVESVASEVLQMPVSIRYYLSQRRKRLIPKEPVSNVSVEVDDDIMKTAEEVFGVNIN